MVVFWNDVKKGDVVKMDKGPRSRLVSNVAGGKPAHYRVVDNKKGIRRMVEAPNGDMGDMYIAHYTHVLSRDPNKNGEYEWLPLAITTSQAKQLKEVAVWVSDPLFSNNIYALEKNGKTAKQAKETK